MKVKLKKNKRGYLWVTLGLFIIGISMHWTFAWFAYVQDEQEYNQPIQFSNYFSKTFRDTMENWSKLMLDIPSARRHLNEVLVSHSIIRNLWAL
jgi:hypothetical protein